MASFGFGVTTYEAPAKLNLSLLVSPPRKDRLHPLVSLVQTVDWLDRLDVEPGEGEDRLETEIEDNLVLRALALAREVGSVPPLALGLEKEIPVAAGLGGGSSDAAAALVAASDFGDVPDVTLPALASRVGADVPLFLTGGTLMISGVGEIVEVRRPLADFAIAVALPEFGLATKEVYERWDQLEGPEGDSIVDGHLPPALRGLMPMRNDLLPAALSVEPRLGDFMSDLGALWSAPVCLTGSGSACFGYFPTLGEADDAAAAVSHLTRAARGVELRDHGVSAAS